MARRRARHRDAAAGALVQAERIRGAREFEIDEMEAIGNHEADGARQLLGDFLQPQADQVAKLQAPHHRGAHRHRARADAVFLVARQIDQLAHPRQRVRQARHRRSRQAAAIGNFQIAEPRFMALEAAQHVERARHHLDNVALACEIAGEHSLLAEPLRASSHVSQRFIPPCGIKFHLQNKLPQAICGHNKKPFARAIVRETVPGERNARNQDRHRGGRTRLRASRRSRRQRRRWRRRSHSSKP